MYKGCQFARQTISDLKVTALILDHDGTHDLTKITGPDGVHVTKFWSYNNVSMTEIALDITGFTTNRAIRQTVFQQTFTGYVGEQFQQQIELLPRWDHHAGMYYRIHGDITAIAEFTYNVYHWLRLHVPSSEGPDNADYYEYYPGMFSAFYYLTLVCQRSDLYSDLTTELLVGAYKEDEGTLFQWL